MNKQIAIAAFMLACTQAETPDASISVVEEVTDAGVEVEVEEPEVECIPPAHQKILMVGDSQAGFTSWRVDEMKRPGETVVTTYKGGTSLGYWNFGHFSEVLRNNAKPDVLIVFLGTVNFNFPYLQPIQNILDEITKRQLTCIWVGPTKVYGKEHVINQLLKEAVVPTCTYVDTETLDIPLEDGVHPSIPGAIKWLQEIWKVKDSITCIKEQTNE